MPPDMMKKNSGPQEEQQILLTAELSSSLVITQNRHVCSGTSLSYLLVFMAMCLSPLLFSSSSPTPVQAALLLTRVVRPPGLDPF